MRGAVALAALAALAAAAPAIPEGVPTMEDGPLPIGGPPADFLDRRRRPWWESGGHSHGKGKLRKGTRPRVRAWRLKPEAPPG